MFIRRKKNRSGTMSIVVVDKSGGKFKEIKSFGVGKTDDEIKSLVRQASEWMHSYGGQMMIDFDKTELESREIEETERVMSNMDAILINGTQLLFSKLYDRVGFNAIPDEILRHLTIARASIPQSKRATAEYLKTYYDEDVALHKIYRYMDKLYDTQMSMIQRISVEHTRKTLGGRIGMMFYDVSTLYFETSKTDDLREPGYSKDGKTAESQVVLGLLVSEGGYPLSYSLYNGSQYEGYTMIPMIDDFKQRYNIEEDFVIVADSGLMSAKNISMLRQAGYKFIVGARIKSEPASVKEWILSQPREDGKAYERKKENGDRLIVSYSANRAKKDACNRERGVKRLRDAYKSGTITKDKVNRMGYNKFLCLDGNVKVAINEQSIIDDEKWDGLKGYITNTELDCGEVLRQYRGLWIVERAFRIVKGTLETRPMFHFTERRIEAHVCICFCAYKLYKELQRLAMELGMEESADTIISIAKTITTVRVRMPHNKSVFTKTMFLTERQRSIRKIFDFLGR